MTAVLPPTKVSGFPHSLTICDGALTWLSENHYKDVCMEFTGKYRISVYNIIRSHMNALELCRLNMQSLIVTTAEKYLQQLNIVAAAPGIQSFSASENWCGYVRVPHLKTSLFLGWAYAAEQQERREEKTTRISRPGPQESGYRHRQNAADRHLQHTQEKRAV